MPSYDELDASSKGKLPAVFAAKLRKPDLGAYLQRERLYRLLDQSGAPLVVVHADAGYGKTLLVASYLRERGPQAIWYHIGTTDRIPGTFTAHMLYDLSSRLQSLPEEAPSIEEALADPYMAGAAIASLLGRLNTPASVVLEDYSRAEEHCEIHQIVLAMVEHLPPGCKIYLLSRHRPPLPLARLAMEGRAQVIAKEDLVFNWEETAALFTRTYDFRLSDEELALVMHRLEGWPAGLRLTQEALKATAEPDKRRFWANFSSSPALFDYLAEEVLVALPTPTLHFLYQTSIFSDLQPDLLEEFLPGSHPATILGHLARENLFTTSLSGAGTHYRYHNLLRQYLHAQLKETIGEQGLQQLHARAAELYARRDETGYAIGHSLAAGEYQRAAQLMELLAADHRVDVLLDLMEGWLEHMFPEMEAVCGVALRRLLPMSVYEAILPRLHQLAEQPSEGIDRVTRAHAEQRLGFYYYYRGRLDEGAAWLERSQAAFLAFGRRVPACVSATLLGFCYLFKGQPERAADYVDKAIDLAGDDNPFARMNCLFAKAELELAFRRFQKAEVVAKTSLDCGVELPIGSSFSCSTLALALLHQGRTEEAIEAAAEAVKLAEHYSVPQELGFANIRMAAVLRAAGQLDEALAAAGRAIVASAGFDVLLARALLVRAEVAAAVGDPDAGKLWLETLEFWANRGYDMHKGYEGLIAPVLVGNEDQVDLVGQQEQGYAAGGRGASASQVSGQAAVHQPSLPGSEPCFVIRTLGSFRLRIMGRDSEPHRWSRAYSRRLFCYLLVNRGRRVPRDEIVEALWPETDPEHGANRLWVAAHALRRELAPLSDILDYQGGAYCLQLPKETDCDLESYLLLAKKGLDQGDERALREAVALYHGDLLMEYPYDDFLNAERGRLRDLQWRALMTLARGGRQRGQLAEALGWYREAQRLEPLLEEPLLRMMQILQAQDEPGAAVALYQRFREDLWRELGVQPGGELRKLYHQILEGSSNNSPVASE